MPFFKGENQKPQIISAGSIVLVAGWTAFGVFVLPYLVPVANSAASMSEEVGFNNRVAILAIWLSVALATILRIHAGRAPVPAVVRLEERQIEAAPLFFVLGIQTVTFLIVQCIIDGRPPVGEGWYFLPRLYFMSHGFSPYRDFDHAYGPLLIYAPHVMQRVLGISNAAAYALSVWAFTLAGTAMFWVLVRRARAEYGAKLAAFLCLGAWVSPIFDYALQYTLVRYLCGFAALSISAAVTPRWKHRSLLLALLYSSLALAVLLISPEIGCALIPGLFTYVLFEFRIGRQFLWIAATCIVLLISAAGLLPGNFFLVLGTLAAGGINFPILASPQCILLLTTSIVVLSALLAAGWNMLRGSSPDPTLPFGPSLTIAFAIHIFCLIPGALGRADIGHITLYGLGAFLLAFLMLRRGTAWRLVYGEHGRVLPDLCSTGHGIRNGPRLPRGSGPEAFGLDRDTSRLWFGAFCAIRCRTGPMGGDASPFSAES